MKSKQILFKMVATATFTLIALARTANVNGQAIMPAAHPDINIGNYGYPNVAQINFAPFCGSCVDPRITAVVSDAGPVAGPTAVLTVIDRMSPMVTTALGTTPMTNTSPDVVLGNDLSTMGNYIAGVVVTAPSGPGSDVFLLLYSISGPGGALSVGATPYATINISGTGNAVGAAHIDIITDLTTLFPAGGPLIDKFAITWYDASNGIMAYYGSLNGLLPGVSVNINSNSHLSSPDVAAVQRLNPSSGVVEDYALLTYVDRSVSPNRLWYQEWNMSSSTIPSSPVLYDNTVNYATPYSPGVSTVRIDAIDDYNYNAPSAGNANFCIVASAIKPSGSAIYVYNDKLGVGSPTDITSGVPGLSTNANQLPVVAFGQGMHYTVAYYSVSAGTPPAVEGYYATTIEATTGAATVDPNAYTIPLTWTTSSMPGWGNGVAVATTCNGAQNLDVIWEEAGVLYEKNSSSPAPYLFRPANNTAPVVSETEWSVSPNPATDHILLSAPKGLALTDGTTYDVRDLSGKLILQGKVATEIQQINVSKLAAGMYLVAVHSDKENEKPIKFVKQ